MIRRRTLLGLLGLGLITAGGCGPQCSCEAPRPEAEAVTVYLVRHAEKQVMPADAPESPKKDPPLSAEGQMRALGLGDDLPVGELDAVYLTDFQRSRQTAGAVLAVTGIEPILYPAKDTAGLAERLRNRRGQQVLVVGHSNTIPALLESLGVAEPITVPEDQYGDLWVVTLTEAGAELEVRRYGEREPRADALR